MRIGSAIAFGILAASGPAFACRATLEDAEVISNAAEGARIIALSRVTSVDLLPVSPNLPWIAIYSWGGQFDTVKTLRGEASTKQWSFRQSPDAMLCGTYFEVPKVGDRWVHFVAKDGRERAFPVSAVINADVGLNKLIPPEMSQATRN